MDCESVETMSVTESNSSSLKDGPPPLAISSVTEEQAKHIMRVSKTEILFGADQNVEKLLEIKEKAPPELLDLAFDNLVSSISSTKFHDRNKADCSEWIKALIEKVINYLSQHHDLRKFRTLRKQKNFVSFLHELDGTQRLVNGHTDVSVLYYDAADQNTKHHFVVENKIVSIYDALIECCLYLMAIKVSEKKAESYFGLCCSHHSWALLRYNGDSFDLSEERIAVFQDMELWFNKYFKKEKKNALKDRWMRESSLIVHVIYNLILRSLPPKSVVPTGKF